MYFFHVGYPKAGSTTLQLNLFSKHPEIDYRGIFPNGRDDNSEMARLSSALFKSDGINYKASSLKISPYTGKQTVLYSHESVTSSLHLHPDIIVKAQRISELFSDVKIILIIRNQADLTLSHYSMNPYDPRLIRARSYVSLKEWLQIENNKKYFCYFDTIDFHRVIDYYTKIFGMENILVLPLEMIADNLEEFSNRLSTFCSIDKDLTFSLLSSTPKNQGSSKKRFLYNKYSRIFKIHYISKYLPDYFKQKVSQLIDRGEKFTPKDYDKLINKYLARYRSGNNTISKDWNLNLNKYNYPL